MKKLSTLLTQRRALIKQARLANLAFAFESLGKFGRRIAQARLSGPVTLKSAAPPDDGYCATLVALAGSQSVIEEHFSDEDVMELADVVGFATDHDDVDITFHLEELAEVFLAPVRHELETAGVIIDEVKTNRDAVR